MTRLTPLLALLWACPESTCPPTPDAGTPDSGLTIADAGATDTAPSETRPSITHALCWAGGAGFQRCAVVSCRDPFDGRLLVDQNGDPLSPRCGEDGTASCWGVLRPDEDPVEVELITEGVQFVWCEVPE